MRRPNPWILWPAVLTGVLGGALGWMVTDVSCRNAGSSCYVWAGFFAVLAFVLVTIGVGLLLVLVYRSLAEWRQQQR